MDTVVKRDADLVKFDPVRAEIEKYRDLNETYEFDIATPKGEKDARSHIHKLRKVKLENVRKDAKAYYLAGGRKVDAEGKELHEIMDGMIDYHYKPIKDIEDEKNKIAFDKAEEHRVQREADEAERLRKITEAEEEIARKQRDLEIAEEKVRKETERLEYESEAQEREKQATLDAEAKAEQDAVLAIQHAQDVTEAAVQAEKDRQADEVAEAQQVAAMEAEVEAERVADVEHRQIVEGMVLSQISDILNVAHETESSGADAIIQALMENEIEHLTINY